MIKDIAHVALNPLDMDRSVAFYENVFGWRKVFELPHDDGTPWIVYLKICKGHFLELFHDGENDRDYNKIELMMIDPESPQAKV